MEEEADTLLLLFFSFFLSFNFLELEVGVPHMERRSLTLPSETKVSSFAEGLAAAFIVLVVFDFVDVFVSLLSDSLVSLEAACIKVALALPGFQRCATLFIKDDLRRFFPERIPSLFCSVMMMFWFDKTMNLREFHKNQKQDKTGMSRCEVKKQCSLVAAASLFLIASWSRVVNAVGKSQIVVSVHVLD